SFGTHEFMELCRQIGCKTYVNGNLGSGTVQEMSEWVEYMTFKGVSPMADLRKANGHEEPWRVDFFGVGNENWGCGGNMTPEHYANEYRRYQTYVRQYDEKNPIKKVACGANVADYFWTEGVMKTCFDHVPEQFHGFMDFISLHYYTHPDGWDIKGSATEYDDEAWYRTLNKALYIDELIRRHSAIIDQYDPEKKIGLSVDEWGTWFTVEPGTNPGFLYQQSTVRDALVAGISLNVFNKHCDRVKMACIAQMVNVLQAVILTDGDRMLKTPTWHVFHMFRHHQGAELLESSLTGVSDVGIGEWTVPEITESVSEKDGIITITLNNLSVTDSKDLTIHFAEDKLYNIEEAGIVTSGDVHDMNTFDAPETVKEEAFTGYSTDGKDISLTLPKGSVVVLRVK
ncbi:MAG: alpha-N-arabinofuranosidase, partial [Lachnospiraceae bacterium]|nr:alpha-N-arabinofuranosidase [Lachnospiraceae bacterium]